MTCKWRSRTSHTDVPSAGVSDLCEWLPSGTTPRALKTLREKRAHRVQQTILISVTGFSRHLYQQAGNNTKRIRHASDYERTNVSKPYRATNKVWRSLSLRGSQPHVLPQAETKGRAARRGPPGGAGGRGAPASPSASAPQPDGAQPAGSRRQKLPPAPARAPPLPSASPGCKTTAGQVARGARPLRALPRT